MRLLLVEDNVELGQACCSVFKNAQYAVDWVDTGELALAALATEKFELVILDLSLPDIDGLQILQHIRSKKLTTAVMILSARGSLTDRVKGLDMGADDYMTKPFDIEELLARTRMLIRRINGKKSIFLEFGDIQLDVNKYIATSADVILDLTAREFSLLRVFCTKSDILLTKQQIMQSLTTFDEELSPNAIEQTISRLRKKITNSNVKIQAVRGLGYMLQNKNN